DVDPRLPVDERVADLALEGMPGLRAVGLEHEAAQPRAELRQHDALAARRLEHDVDRLVHAVLVRGEPQPAADRLDREPPADAEECSTAVAATGHHGSSATFAHGTPSITTVLVSFVPVVVIAIPALPWIETSGLSTITCSGLLIAVGVGGVG